MNTPSIEQLNTEFSLENANAVLRFKMGDGGIPIVEVQNEQATAVISLQGAHLLSWVPAGDREVIWVSEDASFAPGKSVRGGVPICWPWFGPHEKEASYPAHGFARTVPWQVTHTRQLSGGETQISFELDTSKLDEKYQLMWPQPTVAEYTLTIAKKLTIELTTINKSEQSVNLGQALHTYFNVEDLTKVTVTGLENKDYLDKTDNFSRKTQAGAVTVSSEVDRIYVQTADDVVIDNQQRKIIIKKQGSRSTVIWNPWKEAAEKMGDLGADGYLKMLCVESANAADDTVNINAGERFTLLVTYEVESN